MILSLRETEILLVLSMTLKLGKTPKAPPKFNEHAIRLLNFRLIDVQQGTLVLTELGWKTARSISTNLHRAIV